MNFDLVVDLREGGHHSGNWGGLIANPGFILAHALASIVDRFPGVVSEVRGDGLLIGVKAVVPAGDIITALRDEKLLTVAAGDNVVRFLPPLIVTEAEIDDAVSRLERVCARLGGAARKEAV